MKEVEPAPPPIVRNDVAAVQQLFQKHVVPSYGRFDLVLSHGRGAHVWDVAGKRYLDLGGGIAVNTLGHGHPAITEALTEQSKRLIHVSNYYYTEPQGRLAQALVGLMGPGKCFFSNSGAEANEGLYKLARKFGHDEGRFEILTAVNSFHGRTLAGIAATGQDKVKKGFEPAVTGFRHVAYNDLQAMRDAISPATVAILVEGIQGEGGVTPATPEYLLGLRALCNERRLLLLMDGVQCGYFRTGRFQSYQRLLEDIPGGAEFMPDGISMAKSLGAGFPIGAFWVREPYADLLGPGTHGTTYGGSPLGCAVALKVLEVVQAEGLPEHVRQLGGWIKEQLAALANEFPTVVEGARGVGFMLGLALRDEIPKLPGDPAKTPAVRFAQMVQKAGLLVIPAGTRIIRLLPPLNLGQAEAQEGLQLLREACAQVA